MHDMIIFPLMAPHFIVCQAGFPDPTEFALPVIGICRQNLSYGHAGDPSEFPTDT
jgi:hypothetical protein